MIKQKETDSKKGLAVTLENAMAAVENYQFGLCTNGSSYHFLQKEEDAIGIGYEFDFTDLSDFSGEGETLAYIDRADRSYSKS